MLYCRSVCAGLSARPRRPARSRTSARKRRQPHRPTTRRAKARRDAVHNRTRDQARCPVQFAVSLDGPTDFATWTNNQSDPRPNGCSSRRALIRGIGQYPAALTNVKFLRIQAEGDETVTPDDMAGRQWASPTLLAYSGLNHSTIRGKA
jgi:hypothetical protein